MSGEERESLGIVRADVEGDERWVRFGDSEVRWTGVLGCDWWEGEGVVGPKRSGERFER